MKLYAGKIETIAAEIIDRLVREGDLEVADPREAELDVASVLKEYMRVDRELTERTKDVMEIRGLPHGAFTRTKRTLAEKQGFGMGEEGMSWICTQLMETFMQSQHIAEIFADDNVLRRKVKDILRRHMNVDQELDQQVRQRLKNLEEGTQAWDIEYSRVMDQMKQKYGLKE